MKANRRRLPKLRIALVLASILFLFIGWQFIAPDAIPPLSSRCTPLIIKFTAEGKDYRIVSTVWNATYRSSTPLAYNNTAFVRRPAWVAQKLPSGAAVLFSVPHRDLGGLRRASKHRQLDGIYPYAYYFDSAETPSVVEAFVSETYYRRSSPRIVISEVKAGKTTDCDPPELSPEIPWLEKDYSVRGLRGTYAEVVTKEEWNRVPELVEILSGIKKFSTIRESEIKAGLAQIPRHGRGLAWAPPEEVIRPAGRAFSEGYRVFTTPSHHSVRPIRFDGNKASLLLDRPGLIFYYPKTARHSLRKSGLWIGNRRVNPSKRGWHFDPKIQILFRTHSSHLM